MFVIIYFIQVLNNILQNNTLLSEFPTFGRGKNSEFFRSWLGSTKKQLSKPRNQGATEGAQMPKNKVS